METTSSSSSVSTSISYSNTETLHDTDAYGHSSYDISDVTSNITTTTAHEITTKKDYTLINDAQYTSLRKPGDMIGNSGYINVSTVKGGLPLSCAMSQLGIKIDGQLTNIDLFNSSFPKTTSISTDRNTASTTYDLGDNVKLTQTITLLQDPYTETTTIQTKTLIEDQIENTAIQYTYLPEYLDIQSGSLPYQNIPIRLYNLSAEKLKARVPDEISAFAADSSLDNIDRTLNTISSIRSYYGAMTNRLEHAYNVDRNTSENVQAAESQIRDLDMENEMVNLSKDNILTQAAQAMLAQANQNPQAVLSLLQ